MTPVFLAVSVHAMFLKLLVIFVVLWEGVRCLGCGTNETFSTCHSPCVQTCNPNTWYVRCTSACRKGCGCPYEFVWYEERCIHFTDCPEFHGFVSTDRNEIQVHSASPKFTIFNRR